MEKQEEQQKPGLGSFLPILLIGGAMLLFFQMGGSGDKPKEVPLPDQTLQDAPKKADFDFIQGPGETTTIDTGHFVAKLNSRGGRIDELYLRKSKELPLPASVIAAEGEEARRYEAFEGTRGNGMDFQFHLYFRGDYSEKNGVIGRSPIVPDWGKTELQLGEPALNRAAFRKEGPFVDGNVQEIRFRAPVRIRGNEFEITKIYRFIKGEHFFRQISILRNLDRKEFVWGGPLFFRSMGDLGPAPDSQETSVQTLYGRFYYYNNTLEHRMNVPPSNSMFSFIGCGENLADAPYGEYLQHPNTLRFMGTHSKYFFAYNKFFDNGNQLNQPDGLAIKNQIDPKGKEAFTAVFSDFRLSGNTGKEIEYKTPGKETTGDRKQLALAQQRTDALILDQEVYYGVRTDESHAFKDEKTAIQEFGSAEPEKEARGIIYTSSFLALFSKVRDGIVWVMRFLYLYVGNYGWVIILIASAFKLITFPLNQMQAKSMKKMSALKPELEKINEKYADNPTEKQKKTMEIYKKHNINPAKGCLPIVIQIPIFIALYSAFSESIELWRSPFILWMTDLSKPDTVYVIKDLLFLHNFHINILPLCMVASQLLQQKLTTVIMDPQQKIMMYMMPVIMIFFFWTMPSGVTLYWTIQNILAIVWQLVSDRFSSSDEKPA